MSEQPSCYISKQEFVEVIELMREQYVKDKAYSESMQMMFPGSEIGLYDNSGLIQGLIKLLRVFFPVGEEDGHCEVSHYCYVLNFGKCGDEYESPEALYDRLCLSEDPIDYAIMIATKVSSKLKTLEAGLEAMCTVKRVGFDSSLQGEYENMILDEAVPYNHDLAMRANADILIHHNTKHCCIACDIKTMTAGLCNCQNGFYSKASE